MNRAQKIFFRILGLLLFSGVIFFSFYHYKRYEKGPEIVSINMQEYMTVTEPSLLMKGEVSNTKSMYINGKNILLENKKNFKEFVVFNSGNTIIELLLKDVFGKERQYVYHIYYQKDNENVPKTLEKARKQRELAETLIEKEMKQ